MILVTGATGFVGLAIVERFVLDQVAVRAVVRRAGFQIHTNAQSVQVSGLAPDTDWGSTLVGVDVVVHAAARAHIMRDTAIDPLGEFRRVNVQGTLTLARQAATARVRRFVFISSIGVNGAETFQRPFTAHDQAAPHSPYAASKYEAEVGLQELAAETGMEVVIIRPPLVYGPNAPGNFGLLMRWLQRGIPLPLGAIQNQRSLVALGNLVDLISTCLTHPAAANQTFLVSDGEDVSTTELLQRMGQALGRPALLLPVSASWLKLAATLVGKPDMAQRLCGSLQVDVFKTRQLLGWSPAFTLQQGLTKAAAGHVKSSKTN